MCLLTKNNPEMMPGTKTFIEGTKQVGKHFSNHKRAIMGYSSFPACKREAKAISAAIPGGPGGGGAVCSCQCSKHVIRFVLILTGRAII